MSELLDYNDNNMEGKPSKILKALENRTVTETVNPSVALQIKPISLLSWWRCRCNRNLVDLRVMPSNKSEQHHKFLAHPSLTFVALPLDKLKAWSFELPARHIAFSVLVSSDNDASRVSQFLLHSSRVMANKKRTFLPWNVKYFIVENETLWKEAEELGILQTNREYLSMPLPRIWEADGMVRNVLLELLKHEQQNCFVKSTKKLLIWDMGSGAGRDVAFLAEELFAARKTKLCKDASIGRTDYVDFHITAIDHRYNAKQTTIVQDFFQRRGIVNVTSVVKADLSRWENMREILENQCPTSPAIKVMFQCRFFNRPFLQSLAACSTIDAGTIYAISHFCIALPGEKWNYDHPSPNKVIERNELKDLFLANDWTVLHDEIASDSDHGRTMIHFIARKRTML